LGKADRIGILSRNCADFLCSYYAIGSMGAWMVPLNYGLKAADLDARFEHAEVNGLVVGAEFLPMLGELSQAARARLHDRVFVVGAGQTSGGIWLDEVVAAGQPVRPDALIAADDPLYIGYTSGTTGTPKGVLVPHRAIVTGFLYKAVAYALNENDISINGGPYWHSAPLDFASLAIYLGGTAVIPSGFVPDNFLALTEKYRATNSFVVPTMLQMLLDCPSFQSMDLSSWRCIISGGAPLPDSIKNEVLARLGPVLFEFYGATETRSLAYITPAELAVKQRSVGRLNRDVEIRILDQGGKDLPIGQVGEFFVRGPGIFNGYYKNPAVTAASFRGEWFSLGDMGYADSDGYYYLVDRKNDMIITGGENVFPQDIESVLRSVQGVKDAAVVGIPDDHWGEIIAAFIECESGANIEEKELVQACADKLPSYMKPRQIEFIDTLPRNPMGKVLRRVLRESFRSASPQKRVATN
jgi:acyl-CoA synthetase (AMP-forming)/AMP-acid ligase II